MIDQRLEHASLPLVPLFCSPFFFFNDTATTEIYTLSLHDALPILPHAPGSRSSGPAHAGRRARACGTRPRQQDRKSTRLNSSHLGISYAVFCLKKKKKAAQIRNRSRGYRNALKKRSGCASGTAERH